MFKRINVTHLKQICLNQLAWQGGLMIAVSVLRLMLLPFPDLITELALMASMSVHILSLDTPRQILL